MCSVDPDKFVCWFKVILLRSLAKRLPNIRITDFVVACAEVYDCPDVTRFKLSLGTKPGVFIVSHYVNPLDGNDITNTCNRFLGLLEERLSP